MTQDLGSTLYSARRLAAATATEMTKLLESADAQALAPLEPRSHGLWFPKSNTKLVASNPHYEVTK
jgi:hypothetical protein